MKKCIIVSDSFKGTLSSQDICGIARQSVPRFFPDCEVIPIPVADGGEGTVACFIDAIKAEPVTVKTTGPYGESVEAAYARKGTRAVIEMSSVAGLPMVGTRLNPAVTTTYGLGEVIRPAVSGGCTEILLGLGGSCTNDGGCGAAAALGGNFSNEAGESFIPVGGTLDQIRGIDVSAARELLKGVKITVMCDVKNPLYGETGAAYVFGPQKGADPAMVEMLDQQLRHLDAAIVRELGMSVAGIEGAGAAGGMGAGCIAFLGAELKSGIDAVLDMVDFEDCLKGTDLVITGEGRIDSQSVHGKVISGIARHTRRQGIPLVAIVGSIAYSAA